MLNYTKLARKPKQFQKFTGITVPQFDFLFSKIEKQYKITEIQRLSKRERIRDIGAGRSFKLPVKERILMLLIYYRCYTSYDLLEYLFGVDSSTVCRDITKIEPAVIQCIPIPAKIYADLKKITNIQELQVFFPDFYAITDATEQQIPRPKDKLKRRTHYSGKKKKHTVKNQITINLKGEIIHKPSHAPGSHHDYNTFKSKHPILPEDVATFYDLGYQGVEKDFPKQISILPHKKKKGEKLTDSQKLFNKAQSKIRIKVEHIISRIKKSKILSDVFRNKLCRYDTVSEIVCGLVNFKIRWKQEFVVMP